MAKKVGFEESVDKAFEGLYIAARAVSKTLGPNGKNVYIADPIVPKITNDGVSIASKIILEDPDMDAGAWVVRSASGRASDGAGDGTTTTTALLEAGAKECRSRPENPMRIKESLMAALPAVLKKIKAASKTTSLEDARHIAEVSAENPELAELITEIYKKKGAEAYVMIEDSETSQSSIELADGYDANVGCMSPWLVTDAVKQEARYKDVAVLCSHKKVNVIAELLPLYEALSAKKVSQLVIVCDDMNVDALAAIIQNKQRGTFSTLCIRATGELLDDIAAVVGATPVSEQTGVDFASPDLLKHLGKAKYVVSTYGSPVLPGRTSFVGRGNTGKQKATALEQGAKNATNELERKSMRKRAARLRSGVAVLKIGAYSEQDRGYLKDKADDAVKAVKSALEEGYVEGGGMCLYRIAEGMQPKTVGEEILKKVLTAPLRTIIENGGKDYADIIKHLPSGMGYDAKNHTYRDLIKVGIIDPAKVERIAVESAISSVGEFITTHCSITDIHEK